MRLRQWNWVALFGLVLLISEVALSADDEKEVPLPELPKGAGKLDKDPPKSFTKTQSGLKYRVLRKSDGKKPSKTSTVTVHYHGWLDNGKVFDSSYKRNDQATFPLDGVIKGWTEGLQLVGEGSMIELEIPHELAYGVQGRPGIPSRATLHFLVELNKVR